MLSFAAFTAAEEEVGCEEYDQDYQEFVARYARTFVDELEYREHRDQYCINRRKIEGLNEHSRLSVFEENCFADYGPYELGHVFGTGPYLDEGPRLILPERNSDPVEQVISAYNRSIDWVKAGMVSPVKS